MVNKKAIKGMWDKEGKGRHLYNVQREVGQWSSL